MQPSESMTFGQILLMLIELVGGLGIFMFGMKTLSEGLEKTAGDKLKVLLQSVTKNRVLSVICGIIMTILVQSSTATTVMVVGFVNADMLTLAQAIGIIMGANIGTTVTPLILSISGETLGLVICFVAFMLSWLPDNPRLHTAKEFSPIVMGIGLLFVGMTSMSNAMKGLRDWEGFRIAIQSISTEGFGGCLLCVLLGIVLCIALNSSAACVGLLQTMADAGLIDLRVAMFILFGTNIGTCLTSVIAGSGTNTTARRTSIVHLLFNTIGSVLFVLITYFTPLSTWITNLAPDSLMLQIALTHIIFNLTTTLILLPAAGLLEKLAILLIKDKGMESSDMRLKYFDTRLTKTPPLAVAQLQREVERMGEMAVLNFNSAFACFDQWDDKLAEEINERENVLDFLNREIGKWLTTVKGMDLGDSDSRLVGSLFHVINDLERVGDHSVNILEAGQMKQDEEVKFTPKVMAELTDMRDRVASQLDIALDIFHNPKKAAESLPGVENAEEEIDNLTEALRTHHVDRLKNKKCSAKNGMIYLDMLTNLERIGDHAENIATARENK